MDGGVETRAADERLPLRAVRRVERARSLDAPGESIGKAVRGAIGPGTIKATLCPLSDGEIDGEVVVCGCHGSRFRLRDGSIEQGPATAARLRHARA